MGHEQQQNRWAVCVCRKCEACVYVPRMHTSVPMCSANSGEVSVFALRLVYEYLYVIHEKQKEEVDYYVIAHMKSKYWFHLRKGDVEWRGDVVCHTHFLQSYLQKSHLLHGSDSNAVKWRRAIPLSMLAAHYCRTGVLYDRRENVKRPKHSDVMIDVISLHSYGIPTSTVLIELDHVPCIHV